MSEQPDPDSKTEDATEKKIFDTIEKGQTAFSREAAVFASLCGILVVSGFLVVPNAIGLVQMLAQIMDTPGEWNIVHGPDVFQILGPIGLQSAIFILPVVGVFMLFGIASSVAQNLPQISLERISPDLSRISPKAGFKRIFGLSGQVEFAKSIAKLLAVGCVAAIVLRSESQALIDSVFVDPGSIPARTLAISIKLISALTIGVGIIVAADIVWVRIKWYRDLRMTRQEIKDEMKESEGDPIVKSRLRSLAISRARKRMMASVPRATLVIANPTHYAIALRYVSGESGAPVVLAKGKDLIALKIRELAEKNGIPVVEDKALARSMFDAVAVDQLIPAAFYKAVAGLIHILRTEGQEGLRRRKANDIASFSAD
ncbi:MULTISPECIES: flagellar biosynthesis protein FlhB [unclassified Beijerinckia]|uniref:flagellar biosynthesis protein FlhB n=1 Tax=unclassified Beijerinckia TaxID=2638183 RepID=UPI00089C6BBD|nr:MULTISPECIES: flagellar biosynthesis protein FlhB [unclassified Beijerinckia]MDH7798683.1 flagellar biosynthetic protein FlhB [Beijerinckia sp. GAS462]SED29294.1 flagellar biosynthetic protein FlhB [Beijerinckia sp. 28-YEA-48]